MKRRLKNYLQNRTQASVDGEMFDELRREMKKTVPEIAESIRAREARAAELRIATSKPARSKKQEQD